tara:strand:+ start:646 stop:1809 length:1164 start_codon:yes stop_codon:yes gene_type:complete
MAKKTKKETTEQTSLVPDGDGFQVGHIAKYIGPNEDDLPFEKGDLVKLAENDKDGFIAVAIGGDPEDGISVFPDEIEEVDEEIAENANEEHEASSNGDQSAYDEAKAETAKAKAKKKLKVKAAPKKKAPKKKEVTKPKAKAKETKVTKVAKVAKPKAEKAPEEPKELIITKEVEAAIKGKSAVNAARALVKAGQINDFNLGGVLAKIARDKDYLKVVDPETGENFTEENKGFERFVENDLGIKYQKGRYLIKFYQTFAGLKGVSQATLAGVKYSKAKEILDVVSAEPESANEWLTDAKDMKLVDLTKKLQTARERLDIVRTPRGTTGSSAVGMTTVKFRVFNDQATQIDRAIQKAKKQVEIGKDETDDQIMQKCIVHIFTDWEELQS